jgi:hypothetical protein
MPGKECNRSVLDSKLVNQQTGCMKTTIDLPTPLVKQVKLYAVRDGRKMKDVVAELLRAGLAQTRQPKPLPKAKIVKDKLTGLPVIQCPHSAPPGEELTPDRVADILLEQEVEWSDVAGR